MIAFVDESIRQSETGFYLLTAVMVADRTLDTTREALYSVLLPGQHRFHWRPDSDAQRYRMLTCLAELGCAGRGYVFTPMGTCKQARARALCLNRLLWDLVELGVDQLIIESREPHNDERDRLSIVRAQKAARAPAELRYAFNRPTDEPGLWLADVIAGAVAHQLGSGDASYLDRLAPDQITTVVVGP